MSKYLARSSSVRLDERYDFFKDKDITKFDVAWIRDFGRDFYAPQKFVEEIEKMLLHFYAAIAQHLTQYVPPVPKIKATEEPTPTNEDIQ